jgi:hypothetical protein
MNRQIDHHIKNWEEKIGEEVPAAKQEKIREHSADILNCFWEGVDGPLTKE